MSLLYFKYSPRFLNNIDLNEEFLLLSMARQLNPEFHVEFPLGGDFVGADGEHVRNVIHQFSLELYSE